MPTTYGAQSWPRRLCQDAQHPILTLVEEAERGFTDPQLVTRHSLYVGGNSLFRTEQRAAGTEKRTSVAQLVQVKSEGCTLVYWRGDIWVSHDLQRCTSLIRMQQGRAQKPDSLEETNELVNQVLQVGGHGFVLVCADKPPPDRRPHADFCV